MPSNPSCPSIKMMRGGTDAERTKNSGDIYGGSSNHTRPSPLRSTSAYNSRNSPGEVRRKARGDRRSVTQGVKGWIHGSLEGSQPSEQTSYGVTATHGSPYTWRRGPPTTLKGLGEDALPRSVLTNGMRPVVFVRPGSPGDSRPLGGLMFRAFFGVGGDRVGI